MNQQYIQIKINNYNENKFKFKKLPDNLWRLYNLI